MSTWCYNPEHRHLDYHENLTFLATTAISSFLILIKNQYFSLQNAGNCDSGLAQSKAVQQNPNPSL
jgi:hypothetical protein